MLPAKVNIVEVGARDGLQNETAVTLVDKIRLINLLSSSGLKHIEAGSFVSPKWVPQMADSDQVFAGITQKPNVVYSALTPNLAGLERALESGVKQIAVFGSASEAFSQKNINCSIAESLSRFEPVIELAKHHNIPVRGYLSCTMVCPYEGDIMPEQTTKVANTLFDMGCYEISLGDTVGKATPNRVIAMLDSLFTQLPKDALAVHFHDTYGQALANIYQALLMGINTVDSAVAGLGGCPYAKGASGNVATEDVLYLCEQLGIETGVDLNIINETGWQICHALGKRPSSKVALALGDPHSL
ncbi:hydroxymethylglutaryl-CoA lyase [Vibrio parahaemolyticus]|uniref:hydroxymethylglutaryl-CoA lyase n=1 Tax=Vibrio parahaemolyticus TaxID=670 RepID=UPI00041832E0|nr:hydroxymethylglutaryl-CoA lyase [Vibrio parahaemolyticus]EGQ7946086.1 hydroxymethylglutaryl-CoA lyase [Vibrio parahaemolyticus]EHH2462001.1 hydroxymethylglutaryl-CoA lyase [Vibrio parahaemolyticus]EJG1727649.1 hydroxymethylglutaryl-CoA lyase [Vibrio parahaemolyticus]OCP41601.1 hydroxymethylglutaryl-CoA lyase [Vibrio parahaemolyticus]OCP43633.1 hydroxymethylglutaryl-CoA lyase [Vibrio parahaemolyticus]